MARRKAPENETVQEATERREREAIANHATRSEKVSWERQYGNLQKILTDELQPIEEEILGLMVKKNEVFDRIVVLRDELIVNCIHPYELVAQLGEGEYVCKFCEKRLKKHDVTEPV